MKINTVTGNAVVDLALDTIRNNKQALVFVNSKRSAEKCADDIADEIKTKRMNSLSKELLSVLSNPTDQCKRLSEVALRGVVFHHAGLVQKQKTIIENGFRDGKIDIICCTPTLAAGVDLPAFRTIIRDLKRYSHRGLVWIPVLEYHQQAGRAGRPSFDDHGESIVVAGSKNYKEIVVEKYINGEPEEIFSKLAVEPVLRTYLLSLIATDFVKNQEQITKFFSKTFWAYQFHDMDKLNAIILRMLGLLEEWQFIESSQKDFVTADKFGNDDYKATILGRRVAQLYLDPYTANHIVECLRDPAEINAFSFLQMVAYTLEMRPLLRVKTREWPYWQQILEEEGEFILMQEPALHDPMYERFIKSVKTGYMLYEWIMERDEEYMLEKYKVRPGLLRSKIQRADWLLYSGHEIARILKQKKLLSQIANLRVRLKYGVKPELLPLLQLKNIGKVRARRLYNAGIRNLGDVKKATPGEITRVLGKNLALDIKSQVGQDFDPEKISAEKKKKGQTSLGDF